MSIEQGSLGPTALALPPIGQVFTLAFDAVPREFVSRIAQEKRERILLDRVAELEADAERLDSGRIVFDTRDGCGEPLRVVFSGVDLRAAIDAARGAK